MKKIKLCLMTLFIVLFVSIAYIKIEVFAGEGTAITKGFDVKNLDYKSEKSVENEKIETKSYLYGKVSLWVGAYEYLFVTKNESTMYAIYFIEASIESSGKVGKDKFFRNKDLTLETEFYTNNNFRIVNHTTSSEDAVSTVSKTICGSGEIGVGNSEVNGKIGGSFTLTSSQSYSTVNLIESSELNESYKLIFNYHFTQWKDGKMISPNIGLVTKRLYVIYEISNYDSNTEYEFLISSTGTIFKDAKWPKSNSTKSGTINFNFKNCIVQV